MKQVLTVVILFISGSLCAQESVNLKYGFATGKKFLQNTQLTLNQNQNMGGQEIKVFSESKTKTSFVVDSVDPDEKATVLVSALDLSVHSIVMGKDTTMQFNDLKDKSRVVFSNTGKSLSTAQVDSSQAGPMVNQLDFGRLRSVPGKPVKVGEKWIEKDTATKKASAGNPIAVDVASETEYTLVGKETKDGREYSKVTFTGTMNLNGKGNMMGMEMFLEGTGKSQGFYFFDPGLSMIVYNEEDTELNMNVAVSGPQNMSIPMTQSMKTVVTFEEVK